MKFTLRTPLAFAVIILFNFSAWSQCVPLPTINFQNPSFEGPVGDNLTPAPWTKCMPLSGGGSQTPDTQPGSWGVTLPPTNGNSYIGLVHEPSTGWQEGASEPLSTPFVSGVTYSFTVDVANSATTGGGIVPGCAELEIWGGFSACDQTTLLWHSGNITPYDVWQTDTVRFTATQNYTWCMFQVNSLGCSSDPYILVDNIGPVIPSNVSAETIATSNDHCAGDSTGSAVVHTIGNSPPFSYHWSTPLGSNDSVLSNVPAGTYIVTVTDAHTCLGTAQVTINQPSPFSITPTVIQPTCGGANTGSAYISYAGGTSPVTFDWSNGVTTQPNPNLFVGTYNITAADANGCSAVSAVTITSPATITITAAITNAHCQQSDGIIAATAAGGSLPYNYTWNTGPVQHSATATGLASNSYVVTVTDNNSCTASASFAVSQPPNGMTGSLAVTPVLCFGASTGSISSTTTGGSPPYTYAWSNAAATSSLSNLAAGVYSVTINDQSGCGIVLDTTVAQPAQALSATLVETDIKCFGQSTGSARATGTGGTAGYTYSWNTSPVQTTATAGNLMAGNYTVSVTDAHGCTLTSTIAVNQPASALAITASHIDVLCYGNNTGNATVTASGGTTAYTYNWSTVPVQTTATASNLTANTYTITVTDANLCSASLSATISQPASPLTVRDTLTAPICFGQAAATAKALPTGGTPGAGYTYLWNTAPTQSTQSITNVQPGNYTVTVTDGNSCTASASIAIATPPTALAVTTAPVNVLCFGQNTGSITANASGSYGGYTYVWSTTPAQNTATASQLIAGNYTVTVSDLNGCTATAADVVTQPASALTFTTSKTDVLCFGNNTGAASVTANGGTTTYNYLWSTNPQQTTAAITLLTAGNYAVTVTDANACTASSAITISQPAAALQATSLISNIQCHGNTNGSIQITTTGGTSAYTYQWTPAGSGANETNLSAGNYAVTITDANNCSFALSNLTITEPAALQINTAITNVSCPAHGDGKIISSVAGGVQPYLYNWNNGETLAVDTLLSGGNYQVTITDANGCTIATNNLLVAELPGVQLSTTVTNILCFPLQNGALNISASSSFMPLQYRWNTGATTPNLNNIDTGWYAVTVTDAHQCTAAASLRVGNDSAFSVAVTPDTATINLGTGVNITLSPIGSTFGNIEWIPSEGLSCSNCANPFATPTTSITYEALTTDIHGCTASARVNITVIPSYEIFIPNAFTPNGDGSNDYFEVYGNKEAWKYFSVQVFDRWGEKVMDSNDPDFKWDGQFKGKQAPMAVYVYEVHLVYLDNHTDKLFKGTVTLIR